MGAYLVHPGVVPIKKPDAALYNNKKAASGFLLH